MILQALTEYYESLAARGEIARAGWAQVKVSYALVIDEQGQLTGLMPLKDGVMRGKKMVEVPRIYSLPQPVKRTAGIGANFLFDNAAYLLGLDLKGDQSRAVRCFAACKQLHSRLLGRVDDPAAQAVCAFFTNWQPGTAGSHPLLAGHGGLLAGVNLIFRYAGRFVHQVPAVAAAWDADYQKTQTDAHTGICLVTGRREEIPNIHPAIKGVRDAQSSGAALVSFNAPAFESYEKTQNFNAPVGKYAAFAYTTALNHLLSHREHVRLIGDMSVVYWAQNGDERYAIGMEDYMLGTPFSAGAAMTQEGTAAQTEGRPYGQSDLQNDMEKIARGNALEVLDEQGLDPDMPFYILGLSPNAARISVRFFYRSTFAGLISNIAAHYQRLEIVRPSFDPRQYLGIQALVDETINEKMRDKKGSAILAGALLRAVLQNLPYPAALWNGVILRIRAERQITRGRAAIIKAILTQTYREQTTSSPNHINHRIKEVLSVALNEQSRYVPYLLGRLFSVLEGIQNAANPNLNATIRDRYFSAASSTPGAVFPQLLKLGENHIRVVKRNKPGLAITLERQLGDIIDKIDDDVLPARLDAQQEGAFFLGYYHQTQKRFAKKNNDITGKEAADDE